MTESTTPAPVPAGWYPTAPGSTELRWWDGAQWTDHSHTLGADTGGALTTPAGTSPSTVWIWIFAVLPLAQLLELPFLTQYYRVIAAAGTRDPEALLQAETSPSSGLFALWGISLLIYAVWVVLAALDYRALKARGVERPFHWAWTFLSSVVYVIGRAVVARRRTGSGLAPMWVFIVAWVIAVIGSSIIAFSFAAEVIQGVH